MTDRSDRGRGARRPGKGPARPGAPRKSSRPAPRSTSDRTDRSRSDRGDEPEERRGPRGGSGERAAASRRPFRDDREGQAPRRPSARPTSSRPARPRPDRGDERDERRAPRSGSGERAGATRRPFREEGEGRSQRPTRKPGPRPWAERERDPSTKRTTGRGPDPNSRRGRKADAESDGLIRLNRYLAQAGVASRREADDLIKAGVVTINGKVVTELGTKVRPGDKVHYGGQRLSMEQKRYVLLNKPKDFITTTDDPHDRRTVMALVENACPERLYPVGRLDRNTTGVLLMTNDGDLAKKLTHPSHGAEKIYHVTLDKAVTKAHLEQLVQGVELEDGPAQADEATFVQDSSKKEVGLKLHMGRNRIVRRMFETLGYEVVKLDRVVFAGLTKKDLPRGKWRHLTEKEVLFLTKRR